MKCAEKWQIKLEAETSLLKKLSAEFCNPELRIFHDSDCWFLESANLDSDEKTRIYEEGEKLIDDLNNMLWLITNRPNSIRSNGYCLLTSTGERVIKFLAIGTITAPTRLIVYSHDIPSRQSLDLFSKHEKVSESLALFNNSEIDWFTLYKIYETVLNDEPGFQTMKSLVDKEWDLKDDSLRFRETANHWHRHSKYGKKSKKPDNEMALSDGQRFIRKVLINWLAHKSTTKSQTQSN